MATGVVTWSKTAATNNTADSAVNWQEGQAPSSVNDSARGMMAATAKYRDDTSGVLTTSGTSTAYTISSNQGFASLAAMDGAELCLTFHATSGSSPTLAVDGLAAKPINVSTSAAVGSGAIAGGSVWSITYNNTSGVFLLRGVPATLAQTTGGDLTLSGVLTLSSTDHMTLPKGTTAQRPGSPAVAYFRFNSDLSVPEFHDGASWNTLTPALPVPQGRLTLTSNAPILAADVTSATVVYYTFHAGSWVVIHNGTLLIPYQMPSQMSLTLTSSQAASNIYDIFLAYNSGTPVIGTGPSWSAGTSGSVTAGSCARGTGAGGAALTRLNGVYVNAASISLIWNTGSGNTTITVPANQGVYLGSIFIDGSAGQVTCHVGYGQSRKWSVWNAYNRKGIALKAGDATATWNYDTVTFRPSNNNAANSITIFSGLTEEEYSFEQYQNVINNGIGAAGVAGAINGIGFNSTSVASGFTSAPTTTVSTGSVNFGMGLVARHSAPPALGINVVTALEKGRGTGSGTTWSGTEANSILSARWRA